MVVKLFDENKANSVDFTAWVQNRTRIIKKNFREVIIILFTQPLRSGRIWHKVSF